MTNMPRALRLPLSLAMILLGCAAKRESQATPDTLTTSMPSAPPDAAPTLGTTLNDASSQRPDASVAAGKRSDDGIQAVLASLVSNEHYYEGGVPPTIVATAGGARQVAFGSESITIVPIHIHRDKDPHEYCRLAVIHDPPLKGELVNIAIDYMFCHRMEKLEDVDLNHDGVPDLIFAENVLSNRHPELVREGVVYISDARKKSYCHSPGASSVVTAYPRGFSGVKTVRAALEAEIKRLGEGLLGCVEERAP